MWKLHCCSQSILVLIFARSKFFFAAGLNFKIAAGRAACAEAETQSILT
jgi:hypothetical protein